MSIQPNVNAHAMPIGPQMDTRGRFGKNKRQVYWPWQKIWVLGQRAALGAIAGAGVAGNWVRWVLFGLSGAAVGGPMGLRLVLGLVLLLKL
ncbi:MAG: hypothetical protein CM15mV110_120 [Caudoviricetes sp.]|nr:MAG: hypothetical protein CM15mV110_120 [Caudoviricetes sp.]